MNWVVLGAGLLLAAVVAADLELRRRGTQHAELVADRQRARRMADLAPLVRDEHGYRAAVAMAPRALPSAPREPLLEGRRRAVAVVGAVVLSTTGVGLSVRPHHPSLHLDATLAGLTRSVDDRASRVLQLQARQELDASSGLAQPVVGRYGPRVLVVGARVVEGDGVVDAVNQLGRVVAVQGLTVRPDRSRCGRLTAPDGTAGTGCLLTGKGVVIGVLDTTPGVTPDTVAALARRVLEEGVR